jgi:hypothetical protein
MPVSDWFDEWQLRHTDMIPRGDWPVGGSDFWIVLAKRFVRDGVTLEHAEAASDRMLLEPADLLSNHHRELLRLVDVVRRESGKPVDTSDPAERRRLALESSRDCCECDGMGLSVRWHQPADGPPYPFTVYCHRCEMGRWVKLSHEKHAPDLAAKIADLAHFPAEAQDPTHKIDPRQRAAVLAAEDGIRETWRARVAGAKSRRETEKLADRLSRWKTGALAKAAADAVDAVGAPTF